jgi:hypothetical protein
MLRALTWIAGFVLLAAVGAAFAPASLVVDRLAQASGGAVRAATTAGTVWRGRATLTDAAGRVQLPVAWRLDPWPLLGGEVRLELEPVRPWPAIRGQVIATAHALAVRDLEATLPAGAFALPAGVRAGGELRILAPDAAWVEGAPRGTLRAEWRHARVALPGAFPLDLGTASVTLAAESARWSGPVQARGGYLTVDGKLDVDRAGVDLDLAIAPQPGAPAALRQVLGPPDASGVVRWRAAPRFR